MSETAYQAGLAAFKATFEHEESLGNGKPFRSAAKGKEAKHWWLENGAVMTHRYLTWRKNHPNLDVWITPDGTPAIELQTNITLPDGTVLKAFIDRVMQDKVTGDLLIVDLKTGKTTPGPLQLAVYRLCVEETFGVSPKHGAYWMARTGELDTIHDLEMIPPVMVSRWLRDVKKAIDMRLFVPKMSRDCSWCGVKEHCYTQSSSIPRPDFNDDLMMTTQKEDA